MSTNTTIVQDIKASLHNFLKSRKYTAVGVLCDENTEQLCLNKILDVLPEHWLIRTQSGEEHKNITTCGRIWHALTEGHFDRNALLINLGGGVIGDMGGFAASTYKRGIDFINIPTTLLAQVDASVGGKLGIDFNGLKNHIGLFREPEHVFIDPSFLETLSERELRSGYAEVLKHGLITDANYWNTCKSGPTATVDWLEVVERSVRIKRKVVQEDPLESGLRKILNFGHTIGHAVETAYLHSDNRLLHGEAIAIGMIAESYLSNKFTGLGDSSLKEITEAFIAIYGRVSIDKQLFERIVELTSQDKKNAGNTVHCSLLTSIGNCTIDVPIGPPDIIDSLFYYNEAITSIK